MTENIRHYRVDIHVDFYLDLPEDLIDFNLVQDVEIECRDTIQYILGKYADIEIESQDYDHKLTEKDGSISQTLWFSSSKSRNSLIQIIKDTLEQHNVFTRTDELEDGTFTYATHGLDTPPYELQSNYQKYTYNVTLECEVEELFETTPDGEILEESVSKDELKKRAEHHKKKCKGITNMNPDAGNVEHNVEIFNNMNSPLSSLSNNPVSGPFGDDVQLSAMGESVQQKYEYILPYSDEYDADCQWKAAKRYNLQYDEVGTNGGYIRLTGSKTDLEKYCDDHGQDSSNITIVESFDYDDDFDMFLRSV